MPDKLLEKKSLVLLGFELFIANKIRHLKMIIKSLNTLFNKFGYKLLKNNEKEEYAEFYDLYLECKPYTMTGIERMFALYKAVEYVVKNKIEGDFVECGVWKGGSSMLIAKTLLKFGVNDRRIWMYDTYEGMVEPGEEDQDPSGHSAHEVWKSLVREDNKSGWCVSSLAEVKKNLESTNYPSNLLNFVEGKVEDTIPKNKPTDEIAMLRLDTDWYESTRHEMNNLFPQLVQKGIIIIDDYGHWLGAKKAIDEYVDQNKITLFLHKVDYTARIAVKP